MEQRSAIDMILAQRKEAEEQKSKRAYQSYIKNLLMQLENGEEAVTSTVTSPVPRTDGTYFCLREPEQFLHLFEDVSNSQEACRNRFKELVESRDSRVIEQIVLADAKDSPMWFNSTARGINLRPGLQDNETTKPTVVNFGNPDDNVHALIVGSTGSGKSVFLHNLLFSMMAEYAPWELNIFLVDFKKVSLSKYLSACETPHVKAVAATSEVRYVISLFDHLVKCMRARQTLFSYLGLEKLEQIREKYQVVLPRCVLLVDEFQQLFTEATSRESTRIQDDLNAITKLGRATGYHLIFASQEMSNTLNSSALANFKVRFALRCNADVSSAYLGNSAASRIENRERGIVIENSVDGKEENNRTYKVPFVEDEGGYFTDYLFEQTKLAEKAGYKTVHKYYQEDFIRQFDELENLLSDNRVVDYKAQVLSNTPNCFDILTLGDAVVFNFKKNDCETVFLETGSKKNIGIFSPSIRDLTYICRLLAANFNASPKAGRYHHEVLIRNDLFARNYDISKDLRLPEDNLYYTDSELEKRMLKLVNQRKDEFTFLQSYKKYDSLESFAKEFFKQKLENASGKDNSFSARQKQKDEDASKLEGLCSYFQGKTPEDIPDILSVIRSAETNYDDSWFNVFEYLHQITVYGKSYFELIEPCVFWVIGTELIDKITRGSDRLFAEASNYNILFIFACTAESDYFLDFYGSCNYLFIAGNQEKIYNRWDIPFTQKDEDSIVIDFKVRSAGVVRSFKKYFLKNEIRDLPQLDFDKLLSQEI